MAKVQVILDIDEEVVLKDDFGTLDEVMENFKYSVNWEAEQTGNGVRFESYKILDQKEKQQEENYEPDL